MSNRSAEVERKTEETEIQLYLLLDGEGETDVTTGIGFLDHLLSSLAYHARFDLELRAEGDLEVDDHHTAEDCAIVLGNAIKKALGEKEGIRRFGYAYAPMDEALARAVVDLSGRPHPNVEIGLDRETLGDLSCENIGHVLSSLAVRAKATLHVDVLKGENNHHRAEAAFKATALALKQAVKRVGEDEVPSTKGTLS